MHVCVGDWVRREGVSATVCVEVKGQICEWVLSFNVYMGSEDSEDGPQASAFTHWGYLASPKFSFFFKF